MRTYLTSLIIFVSVTFMIAQDKGDYNWIFGYNFDSYELYRGSTMNFNDNQVFYFGVDGNITMDVTNASISNEDGALLFYTNGIKTMNAEYEQMENGDSLNLGNHLGNTSGLVLPQGALILPFPNHLGQYYVFHEGMMYVPLEGSMDFTIGGGPFRFSLVDLAYNGGLGKVIEKNTMMINDTLFYGGITATRHANGQDWWLMTPQRQSNLVYRHLLTDEGVIALEPQILEDTILAGLGQAVFSPDGTKYAIVALVGGPSVSDHLTIFDFDRCTGLFSHQRRHFFNNGDASAGVAISPNSRYLYFSTNKKIYQLDLIAEDILATIDLVALNDGYKESIPLDDGDTINLVTRFFLAQLAPDGRIYLNTTNGVRSLHVINYPDRGGSACEVAQHSVKLPTYNRFSLPNFPNYRLGPIDGSPCDTLGINNFPQAKYRYDLDTLEALSFYFNDLSYYEPTSWHWDFGDGEMSEEVNPSHTFLDYGTYEVCLTVSNEYGSHTFCQTLDLSLTAFTERVKSSTLSVFPNPAMDLVYLKIEEDNSFSGTWYLYNALGQVMKAYQMDASLAEIDIRDLGAGIYFYAFVEDGVVLDSGKLVLE